MYFVTWSTALTDFFETEVLTFPQEVPNLSELMVSWIMLGEDEAATTRAVLTLPVRDSFSNMVRAESRNGMY